MVGRGCAVHGVCAAACGRPAGGLRAACAQRRGAAARRRPQCSTCRPRPHTPAPPSRLRARALRRTRTTRPLAAPRGPRARPASLLLLAACLAAAACASASASASADADPACPQDHLCAACRSYENAREHSLRVIRESLLAKLGFAQAPNTTGRQLPRVPADLMERFERRPPPPGVQADAPALSRTFVTHTEQDDFLARTDNVLVFAR